jgi:hypothetical protein
VTPPAAREAILKWLRCATSASFSTRFPRQSKEKSPCDEFAKKNFLGLLQCPDVCGI